MRNQSPTVQDIDKILAYYRSGLSLMDVRAKVGFFGRTVERWLKARGVVLRDPHGRPQS